jgi:ABC-2 type transport system permease protein
MNLLLIPIWLLSGAFFPASGAPFPLSWLMAIDPLTYGMAALRRCLYLGSPQLIGGVPSMGFSLLITVAFAGIALAAAARAARA